VLPVLAFTQLQLKTFELLLSVLWSSCNQLKSADCH